MSCDGFWSYKFVKGSVGRIPEMKYNAILFHAQNIILVLQVSISLDKGFSVCN